MYVMLEAPLLCMDLSNGNDHLAQDAQIKTRACARLPDWG